MTIDDLVDLQRVAGNQAVTAMLEDQRRATGASPAPRRPSLQRETVQGEPGATEVDPRARVDQLQLAMKLDLAWGHRWVINLESATAALTGLTADEGKAVRDEYQRRTGHDLREIISGVFTFRDLEIGNDLKSVDRTRLLNLLAGTVAPPSMDPDQAEATGELLGALAGQAASILGGGGDAEVIHAVVAEKIRGEIAGQQVKVASEAAKNRYTAEAAALRAALEKGAAEPVLAMLRRPMDEKQALATEYDRMFHESLYNALMSRLKGRASERAAALWIGDLVTADRLALQGDIEYQQQVERHIDRYGEAAKVASTAIAGPAIEATIKKARAAARAGVEARLTSIAQSGSSGPAESPAEGREHLAAVLNQAGDGGPLRPQLEARGDAVVKAIIARHEPEELAARLARADADGTLKATELEGALRHLRSLGRAAAIREIEHQPGLAPQAEQILTLVTDNYYQRFREEFDKDDTKRTLDQAVAGIGDSAEVERNRALIGAKGALPRWKELDLALRQDPKDIDRVKIVLGSMTKEQVDTVAVEYHDHTDPHRDLRTDVLGSDQQQTLEEIRDKDEARESLTERRVLLQGGKFSSAATDEATRLSEEGHWYYGRFLALERAVMENRGEFAEVRDWMGNLEKHLVERARSDADDAAAILFRVLADSPPDLATARDNLARLKKASSRIERNLGVYKEATKEAFAEFVDFAVLAVTTIVTLGEGTAIVMAIRATAATIGTKLVLKGDDYSVDEFLMDLRSGVGSAVGGKLAEGMLKPLATRIAAYAEKGGLARNLVSKVGNAGLWEAENVLSTSVTNLATGQDVSAGLGVTDQEKNLLMHGVTSAAKAGRGRRRRGSPEGEHQPSMALEEPPNRRVHEEDPHRASEDQADTSARDESPAREDDPWAGASSEDERRRVAEAREEMRHPAEELSPSGGGSGRAGGTGGAPGAGGGDRRPPGPVDPASAGIGSSGAGHLQNAANQLDIVIKVRPVNPESGPRLEHGALAKMELIKAKTITPLDELIGGPPNRRGLVGLFVPRRPDPHLPPDVRAAANRRYADRLKEYLDLRAEYQRLSQEGLVRVEGGVVMVADPTAPGGRAAPRGEFKAVAGDIDIYDITHADGSPLVGEQREAVQKMLQSMGIGVEHGAHTWWKQQSPETYDTKKDARIREQHQTEEPLLAFIPTQEPRGVWADTPVTGPQRDPRRERFTPLRDMQIEGSPETGSPGPGGAGGYVDIGDDAAPATSAGSGVVGAGVASRPHDPPGRPASFAPWATIDAHLQAVEMPARGRARVEARLLLARHPEGVPLHGESGQPAHGQNPPRTDVTQPPRSVVAPRDPATYGPDARAAGHHPGPREHDAEAILLERVGAMLRPGDVGELHIRTNFPTCPSCIDAFYRFRRLYPNIVIVSHTRSLNLPELP